MNRLRQLIFSMTPPAAGEAAAFIAAAGITDSTQQSAITQLVADLKSASIWTKFNAIWPFVGGDATKHSFNLKNPATFQITWHGTVTHNANGVTGDGSTGYGDTGLNPLSVMARDDCSFGFYSRTASAVTSVDIGASGSSSTYLKIFGRYTDNKTYGELWATGGATDEIGVVGTDSKGLFTMTRRSATDAELYRNATTLGNTTGTRSGTQPNKNLYLLATNDSTGVGSAFSARNHAFGFVGAGLTDADVSNFYTAVQAFQTTLSRQV